MGSIDKLHISSLKNGRQIRETLHKNTNWVKGLNESKTMTLNLKNGGEQYPISKKPKPRCTSNGNLNNNWIINNLMTPEMESV